MFRYGRYGMWRTLNHAYEAALTVLIVYLGASILADLYGAVGAKGTA